MASDRFMNRHCRAQLWPSVECALSGIGKEISQGLRRAVPSAKRSRSQPHRFSLAAAVAGLIVLAIGAGSATKSAAHAAVASRPHVFLMRGLLNIFSLGMDELAAKIKQHGIRADVYNHSLADMVVARIVQNYRAGDHGPYILIGHSLGADAVMTMAQSLNRQGVPVALVIPFDGTGSYAASKNVGCVLNLTQRDYAFMRAGAGFHGKLSNVDLSNDASIDHFTIDKSPRLQAYALNAVLHAARSQSCRPTVGGPIVARPKEAPKEMPRQPPTKQAAPGGRQGVAG
jgi:hypothetical protein